MDKIDFSEYIFVVTQEENRVMTARRSEKMSYVKEHLSSVWKELFVIDSVPALPLFSGYQQAEPLSSHTKDNQRDMFGREATVLSKYNLQIIYKSLQFLSEIAQSIIWIK